MASQTYSIGRGLLWFIFIFIIILFFTALIFTPMIKVYHHNNNAHLFPGIQTKQNQRKARINQNNNSNNLWNNLINNFPSNTNNNTNTNNEDVDVNAPYFEFYYSDRCTACQMFKPELIKYLQNDAPADFPLILHDLALPNEMRANTAISSIPTLIYRTNINDKIGTRYIGPSNDNVRRWIESMQQVN